jgi:hypothetical protein
VVWARRVRLASRGDERIYRSVVWLPLGSKATVPRRQVNGCAATAADGAPRATAPDASKLALSVILLADTSCRVRGSVRRSSGDDVSGVTSGAAGATRRGRRWCEGAAAHGKGSRRPLHHHRPAPRARRSACQPGATCARVLIEAGLAWRDLAGERPGFPRSV